MGKKKLAVIDDSVITEEKKEKIQENTKKMEPQIASEVGVEEKEDSSTKVVEAKNPDTKKDSKKKKATKQEKKVKKTRSKKYQEAREKVERNKLYPITEATELAKTISYAKFDGTLEVHINTAVKGVRGLVSLPFTSGKKLKIIAFGKGAEESGADEVGDDAKLAIIEKGRVGYDVIVTTAEWMPKLARAAKVLGPRGLMPNPKNGTITNDLKKTVAELQGGKVEYKSESKANVIHLGIGKLSQPTEELSQNLKVLLSTIGKTRIKKVSLAPTMGPSVKVDLGSL